jgi:spore germination protein
MIYIVKQGDSVFSIAYKFGVSPERIIVDNGLQPPYNLCNNQALLILIPYITHTVQEGETLSAIANKYSMTLKEIFQKNYILKGRGEIYPGQTIIISYKDESKNYSILCNSYAYTFIGKDTLKSSVAYLSSIIPFTYGFTSNGELLTLDDEKILNDGNEYGTPSLLHLSTLNADGKFDNTLSSRLFENENAQKRLIDKILNTVKNKDFIGVEVDFEFVPLKDSSKYIYFLKLLKDALGNNLILIVDLAPKISDNQEGLLYERHNYYEIGNIADYVFLMTYEWGYEYSKPMAIAPINNVNQVLKYALTRVDPQKILLGIPNYAYNWPLPYIEGTTRAISLSNIEAIKIASENRSEIKFDKISKTPYFNYTDNEGIEREVWFEDPRSISEKLQLIKNYGIAGVGIWNSMREFPSLWLQIATNFTISDYLD